MKNVSMIVAYLASSHLSNYYIGTDKGNLPWASFPEDMDRFRTYTMGKVVIMGRKTYESIGKPLEGRINIVITSQPIKGVLTCTNVLTAIQHAHSLGKHVVIIGGAQLYDAAIEYVDEIKLTIADMPLRTYGNPVCLTPRTVAFMHNKFKPTSPIKIAKRTIDGKLVPTIFRTLVRKNINQSGKVGN